MKRFLPALTLGTLFVLISAVAFAQSDRGSIAGSVLDSTGAAVSGASVVVRGTDTGSVYKTVTTGEGVYRISDIAVGRYDVTVEVTGFKTSVQHGVQVQINTVAALNITLQPGDVKEEVSVIADAPTIQTESSDIGTVVGTKAIEELPLSLATSSQSFLRSPETFVFLTPGTTGPGTVAAAGNNGVFLSKLAGGQNLGAEILLDGASVQRQDTVSAFDQTAPSVEALDEFKVTTATPTAQFGRTSGGIESFTTKSGTNSYHGTVFDIFRNQALDANSWDNNYVGAKKPSDHQNDFGGSLGGPVRIPHVYDGHDRTFFFFSWEQYRNKPGTTSVSTVPTQAERGGDFSALLGADTGVPNPCTPGQDIFKGQIFDPSTTNLALGCRKPFPGNKITNLSTVAQNVLQYVPLPNTAGTQNGLVNNFIFNSSDPKIETTMTFRIDESVSEKNKMFFSYSSREQNQLNNTPSFPGPADGTYKNHYLTHYLRYGWDYLASASLLNHFVVGLNRLSTASIGSSVNGTDWPAKLGIGNAFGQVFPTFQFNGSPLSIPYTGLSTGNDDYHYPNSLVFADSISWTKGRHSLRFGGELRFFQFSVLAGGNTSPNYVFQNYETAWAPNDTKFTGDPFASFLLGLPQSENLTINSHFPRWNQRYYALYVQDDFKFSRNLTLNLGLRWDVDTPRHEASGAQSVLSLTATNPATPGFPGALVFGNNATGTSTYFKDIAPRIGFAWSPYFVRDTVVRGAYSIYYAPLSYSDFGSFLTSGTSVNPNFSSGDNFTPVQSLDAGFPAYTAPSNNRDPTLLNFSQNGVNTVLPSYGRPGMVQNWDLEIQHQIMQDLILSIGYVGQHATRLNSGLAQVNTINPKYNYLGASLGDLVDGSDGKGGPAILAQLGVTVPSWFIPGWSTGANAGLDTIGNLLRPFPQFGDINTNCCHENLGQSTYNALQTKLERRFRNGLNLLASYTYSKTITDADGAYPFFSNLTSNVFGSQNPFNLRAEKAVSYQDVPHAFVLSYLYELPVGPGKRYLSHGVASKVLGGWQVGGVQRYQTGSPVLINEFATGLPGGSGGQYPGANYRYSLIPGQSLLVNHPAHWTPALNSTWSSGCPGGPNPGTFLQASNPVVNCTGILDPSAASLAAGGGYVYGNLPQIISSWRSPAYLNEDFSIIKRTTIRESHAILFKLDIPNAFNRHVFGQVDGNIFDPHFGVPGFGNFASIPTVINGARQIQATLRYEF